MSGSALQNGPSAGAPPGFDTGSVCHAYITAWRARDLDSIMSMHAESTMFWLHLDRDPASGREEVREAFADVLTRWPDLGVEVHRVWLGTSQWTLDWTLTAELADRSGTTRTVCLDCVDVVSLDDDGLITREDTFVDLAQLRGAMR